MPKSKFNKGDEMVFTSFAQYYTPTKALVGKIGIITRITMGGYTIKLRTGRIINLIPETAHGRMILKKHTGT